MSVSLPVTVTAPGEDLQSRPEVRAMLRVSRAALRGGPLSRILDEIATEATQVVRGADRASIILIEGREHRFRLAGSHGLSERYKRLLSTGEAKLRPGQGPSGLAYVNRAPVVISDLDSDPAIASWEWRDIAREERYRAIVSLPLLPADTVVGTLNLYRTAPGVWPEEQVHLLRFFAEHAASAVRTAQLLDERGKQVIALRRLVRALREQTHEHANRLHALGGLLALDEIDDAKEFLHVLERSHTAVREALDTRIQVPTLAGLVLAETVVAAQREITLAIDESSSLRRLPPTLTDTQVVTIVGNLLDNAFDAVANLPPERRQVELLVAGDERRVVIEIRDQGEGLPSHDAALFDRGFSTKPGHEGLGLALVREAVTAARGTIDVRRQPEGSTFRVTIDA
ncbi:MAG: GAF domain-containing protein [Solirubrobacterales bacterium]|nr:GAF domain-containing protein [Solirubrobacterales bacterium]